MIAEYHHRGHKTFHVKSISLVKFRTPIHCRAVGGLLANHNDTHWAVLINQRSLIHLAVDEEGYFVIKVERWCVDGHNSPTPCRPYRFNPAKRIKIDFDDLLDLESLNCHKTGEEIARAAHRNWGAVALGVFGAGMATTLTGGVALVTGIGAFSGIGYGAHNLIGNNHGHDGPQ
eukprot:scaffold1402_cov204-Ochromonas_danica.AAC.4